jgi:phenylpropionate dioxygenase-like ring-hydroxylating dioxygenase large terminal subunit
VREDRVHSRVYIDQQTFEDEMEKIFHSGLVFVGHASEIPEPGDYRLAWVGRIRLSWCAAKMARCGCCRIAAAIGRTRSARASAGMHGFSAVTITGWMYRNGGKLASVSYPEAYDHSLRKEDYGLVPLPRMANYRGFIFGSIAPQGMSLTKHLGKATEQIDLFNDLSPIGEIDARGGIHKYSFRGNWKLQIENSMDGYHPNFVHKSFFGMMGRRGIKTPTRHFAVTSIAVTRDFGHGHVMLDYRECNRDGQLLNVVQGADKYREAMFAR